MNYLITLNAEKCTGCRLCELACSLFNEEQSNPEKSRIRAIRNQEEGIPYSVPVICQQCEKPICMELCPFKALYRDPKTNAVVVNEYRCMGCWRCVYVCPFGGVVVDTDKHIAVKCDLCQGVPKCVEFCPCDALQFVRADKIGVKVKREGTETLLAYQKSFKDESIVG